MPHFRIAVFLALVCGTDSGHCLAQAGRKDPDAQYLSGLRMRRLFSLAERHCLLRLADPALPAADRVRLTVELSQCFAEHATYRSGQEQAELWNHAESVITELLADSQKLPGRERLTLQAAYVPAVRGTWLRWQSELAPYDESLREQAVAQLQAAREKLRQAETTLVGADRDAGPRSATTRSPGTLGPAELRQLAGEAKFHLAVASLDLARLLRTGIERTSALHDAETRLQDLSRSAVESGRRAAARILLATAARLRSDHEAALKLLDALSSSDQPVAVQQQAAAEGMRVELDRGQPDAALNRLAEVEVSTGGVSAELLCVGVEARLAARVQALQQGDKARAATLLEAAVTANARIEGPWRDRSNVLLELSRSTGEFGPDLAPLILAARAAQQHGDADATLARYQQAGEQARRSGRLDLAAELDFTSASLLLQAEQYGEAATAFLAVADGDAPVARAAESHLLAAYARGKQWEARPTQANREAYVAALDEHRARFAGQPTFIEAAWMLAAFHESRRQWTAALEMYESVPAEHARAAAARARIAVLYEQILRRLQQTGQPRDDWEHRAVTRVQGFIDQMPAPPAPLTLSDAEVVLSFARIVLDRRSPDEVDTDALLGRVIDSARLIRRQRETAGDPMVDPAWSQCEQSAEQLLIVSLAGQDRIAEAQQSLGALSAADPQSALAVLDGLCEIADTARPEQRTRLGELQLQAAEQLQARRAELTPDGEQRLDVCLAQAFAAVGRPNDAARAYRRVLERAPNDTALLSRAAGGIAAVGTPDAVREAKSLWRRVEGLEKPGSSDWLAARLEVARSCRQLEEIDECRKLLAVTRLLYPELGGPELKMQFEQLEASIKDGR